MRKTLLLASLLAAASPGLAIPTPAGSFEIALPGGTTAAAEPILAGTVISDTIVPFAISSATVPIGGTLQVRVVRGTDNKLAFYWKINNAATSKGSIGTMSVTDFPKAIYDANWRKDGLGTVAPGSVTGQLSSGQPAQWLYGFYFKQQIKPGESSRFFFLRSSATTSKAATVHVTGSGGATPALAALAPAG